MERRIWLTVVLLNVLTASLIIWFYPSNGDFRCDNPFWNGYSKLRETVNAKTLTDLKALPPNPKGLALIMIPYTPISVEEAKLLKGFVEDGGVLIVMDDYGYGNQVLKILNVGLAFTGKILVDPLFNYKSPLLPKAIIFSQTTGDVKKVALNHASTLNVSKGPEVLAWSSSFSFLDLDGDTDWSRNEPRGPFPIAARASLGDGWVVAISDPSIVINSMIELDDNDKFILKVLEMHGTVEVYIEQSHLPTTDLDRAKVVLQTAYIYASSPVGSIIILTLTLIACSTELWLKEARRWWS